MAKLYKRPLGEILVKRGVLTEQQLEMALEEQRRTGTRIGQVLIALNLLNEEQITEARAFQLDFEYANLQDYQFNSELISLVPENIARAYKAIPLSMSEDSLTLAMANPMDIEAIDLIQFETKCRVVSVLATEWRIQNAIEKEYSAYAANNMAGFMEQAATNVEIASSEFQDDLDGDINEAKKQGGLAPIVNMVNILLTQAVRKKASDIHLEPKRASLDVRYRVDGELQQMKSIPRNLRAAVTSRIKIMAELDIAERRLPQDGRITVKVDGKSVDLRVSTNPTINGERIVLRVLDRSRGLIPLEELGFSSADMHKYHKLITQPYGIILVTGPTGSGKTTTLYAGLNTMKSERSNIMTVEDPVEYELEGVSQTQINTKIGLSFAMQLRTLLRQDPDVILVGEIRDGETADIAFRAALTGHLVLSTLHCNDAPSGITRLLDMGVEPFLIGSAVIGIQAQRLVRTLCHACREAYKPDDKERLILGVRNNSDITIYHPVGCSECDNTGYKGRTTIIEIMPINEELRRLVLSKSSAGEIKSAANRAGMADMRSDAIRKVLEGITSLEEVQRKVLFSTDIYGEDYIAKAA